ncbi:MAG: DUF6491 family protein [Xanthomonadales bacterium]|nr:DUF6491 family protein [Xanthomonadales bacterium]
MNTSRNKRRVLLSLLLGMLALPALASADKDKDAGLDAVIGGGEELTADVMYGEVVDKIYAPRISSFRVLDNQRIILYATPFKPYLITLRRKANALRFDDAIAIKRSGSTIHARFDSIIVDGFPYSIKRIEKLDKETAKSLLARDKDKKRKGDESEEKEPGEKKEPDESSSDS